MIKSLFSILLLTVNLSGFHSTNVIEVGTYVFSQKALLDAPGRYASFVIDALNKANEYPLQDIVEDHSCKTSYWIWASESQKKFTIIRGTLSSTIVADGLVVKAKIDAYIKTPTKITWKKRILFCIKDTICRKSTVLTGQFDLSVKITAIWSRGISITAKPSIVGDSFKISGCSIPWWAKFFGNVKEMIHNQVETAINEVVSRTVAKINIPSSFSPHRGIYFTYQITNVQFIPNDRILATASCVVQADKKNPNGTFTRLTFDDPDIAGASTLPPSTWNLTLVNETLYQLQGIRLSSTIMEAFFWGAQTIGAFNSSFTSPFLDTEVTLNTIFSPPLTGINSANQLTVTIDQGKIFAVCRNLYGFYSNMLNVSFKALAGNGTVYATPDKIGIVIQIINFNVSGSNMQIDWPPLPLSPVFVEAIERVSLSHIIPKMNAYFQDNPLKLPPDIAALIPNPRLTLYNQAGCCGGNHGYLDFASFCSTVNDGSQWMKCQFATSSHLLLAENVPPTTKLISVHEFVNMSGLYMLQYSSDQCILQYGADTNQATLIYIPIEENCTRRVSTDNSLFVAIQTKFGVQVGMFCNDTCSFSSCLAVIEELVMNKCYPPYSVIFFFEDSIQVVSGNDSVVVASFGPTSMCDVSNNSGVTFTLVNPNEVCETVGYINDDEEVLIDMKNNSILLETYCSNCSVCKVTVNAHIGNCLNITQNKFELFTKDHLPTKFQLKYILDAPSLSYVKILLILLVLGICCFVILVLVLFMLRKKIRARHICLWFPKERAEILIDLFAETLTTLPEKIQNGIGGFFASRYRRNKWPLSVDTAGCIIASIGSTIVLVLWLKNNPFMSYVKSTIDRIGISDGILCETEQGYKMLTLWASIVNNGIIGIMSLNIFLTIITIFFTVQIAVAILLFVELLVGFSLINFPPIGLFIKFSAMISFNHAAMNDSLPGFVQDFLEPKIQTAFMSMGIASIANWNLFWLQGLLCGCVISCIVFWIWTIHRSDYTAIQKGLPEMIGIVLPATIAVPLASIIAIIFLYQSFGVDTVWLGMWPIWWMFSIIMLIIATYTIRRFYKTKREKSKFDYVGSCFLFILYLIISILVLVYAFIRESSLTTTNIAFAIGYCILPFVTSLSLLWIIFMRNLTQRKDSKQNEQEHEQLILNEQEDEQLILDERGDEQLILDEQCCSCCSLDTRTALYVIGGFCMAVFLFVTLKNDIYNSVMNEILIFLREGNAGLQWPKNGTAFDPAVNLYDKSRWRQLMSSFGSFTALCLAILFCFINFKYSILVSEIFGYLSVVCLFVGLLMVSIPNYLDSMHIEQYLPNCTPQCNKVFSQSVKTTIGLVCAVIFTTKVSVLSFTFPPALARSTARLFSKQRMSQKNKALWFMWLGAPFYSIFMTIIPVVFIMQTIGDYIIRIFIFCFWISPLAVSLLRLLLYKWTKTYITIFFVGIWSLFYVGFSVALVVHSVYLYDLQDYLTEMLWSIDFWAVSLAEVAISLAVPADFIGRLLFLVVDS